MVVDANLEAFWGLAVLAASNGAEVLVLPEFAVGGCYDSAERMVPFCEPVDGADGGAQARNASAMARRHGLYVSLNMCELDAGAWGGRRAALASGPSLYNTQLVFGPQGQLVASYRKEHPWHGWFAAGSGPSVSFEAGFAQGSVELGVFTCKDIAYKTPSEALLDRGVRHFLYAYSMPIVAKATVELWTLDHGATAVAANQKGASGVYSGGKQLAETVSGQGGLTVALADVPVAAAAARKREAAAGPGAARAAGSPTLGALVWSDEFDGPAGAVPDPAKWGVANYSTHGSHELQLYVAEAAALDGDGHLVLRTAFVPGGRLDPRTGARYEWTSAWVSSGYGVPGMDSPLFAQAGGRFEVRAKLPPVDCPGIWPAHWLMPQGAPAGACWPVGGEIDIMEMWGQPDTERVSVAATYHYGEACGVNRVASKNRQWGRYPLIPLLDKVRWDEEFHVFAVEWRVGESIAFFVDDHHLVTLDASDVTLPTLPMSPILNTAIDANYNATVRGWDWNAGPVEHVVDYVRVYELVS